MLDFKANIIYGNLSEMAVIHPLSRELCKPENGQKCVVGSVEYELAGKVGDGASGLVRKLLRKVDGRIFAVKFLAPDPKYIDEGTFDDVAVRFKREGERGARLNHPHLIKIHTYCANENGVAFGGSPSNPFIIMDFESGKTLESYIRNLPKPQNLIGPIDGETREIAPVDVSAEKIDLALQILDGLDHLHRHKLVHRDIKPANIFVSKSVRSPGRWIVRLGDFGIVKWGDFQASLTTGVLTATGQRGLGTLKYMSPEQAIAPNKVSFKSDTYSLGISLFELFTGRILASPHHVMEITMARLARGTSVSRFYSMGLKLDQADKEIGEILLDMHLRGISGRPALGRVSGVLKQAYDKLTGTDWHPPL